MVFFQLHHLMNVFTALFGTSAVFYGTAFAAYWGVMLQELNIHQLSHAIMQVKTGTG